ISSRRRLTRCLSDWSSDVCSSDLEGFQHNLLDDQAADKVALCDATQECVAESLPMLGVDVIDDVHSNLAAFGSKRCGMPLFTLRSEERRVGKEWRTRRRLSGLRDS